MNNLKEIIEGSIAGNRKFQEELYNQFASKMFALCLRYAKNYDEAKDHLQDGFIKAFEKIDQYEYRGSFEGWLRKVIVTTILGKYRKEFILHVELQEDKIEDEVIEDENINLSERELLDMIKNLPPKYKIVFNMYAIEGYSHAEISELLNISEGTSKSNLHRARAILKEQVKGKIEEKMANVSRILK